MTLKDARRLQKLHEFAIQEEARGILLADDSGFGAVISEAVTDAGEGDQTADPGKHGDALDTKTR